MTDCDLKQVKHLSTIQSYGELLVVDADGCIVQWSSNVGKDLTNVSLKQWSPEVHEALVSAHTPTVQTPLGLRTLTVIVQNQYKVLQFEKLPEEDLDTIDFLRAEFSSMLAHPSDTVNDVLQICIDAISILCQFDRVVAYRFDADYEGTVVLENNNANTGVSLLGMSFPSYEIPKPARAMFTLNPVRVVQDSEKESVPLIPDSSFDMKDLYLRGANETHCMYLRKFGVKTSVSIAIHHDGVLWGLFICHSYETALQIHAWVRDCLYVVAAFASKRISELLQLAHATVSIDAPRTIEELLENATLGPICKALNCSAVFVKLDKRSAVFCSSDVSSVREESRKPLLGLREALILMNKITEKAHQKNQHEDGAITTFTELPDVASRYCGAALIQNKQNKILLLKSELKQRIATDAESHCFNRLSREVTGHSEPWGDELTTDCLHALHQLLIGAKKDHETEVNAVHVRAVVQRSSAPNMSSDVASSLSPPPAQDKHIIVCDDDLVTRKILVRLIEKLHPEGTCVPLNDGLDAIRYYIDNCRTDHKVTHILSDRHMDFMDGDDAVDVIRRIEKKEKDRLNPIVIFMLSSDTNSDVVDKNLVQRLLTKPVTIGNLKDFLGPGV